MDKKNNLVTKILPIIISLTIIAGAIVWGVFGSRQISQTDDNQNTDQPTALLDKVKLGSVLPLTGELASLGEDGKIGIEAAVAEFEKENEINVEVVFENDECQPAQNSTIVKKLVNIDKVAGILGPVCSGAGAAGMPIANEAQVPIISGSTSAPTISTLGEYVFRTFPSDALAGKKAAEYIFNNKNFKKAAIIYSNNEYGKGMNDVFEASFKDLGGEIAFSSGYEEDVSDFASEITKLQDNNVEALFFPTYPNNANSFLKQAQEKELDIYILGTDGISGDEVLSTGLMDGKDIILPRSDFGSDKNTKIAELVGGEADTTYNLFTFTFFDATKAMLEAIKRAESIEGEAIKDELYNTDIEGISIERVKFDENGDILDPKYVINVVENGEIKLREELN